MPYKRASDEIEVEEVTLQTSVQRAVMSPESRNAELIAESLAMTHAIQKGQR